MEIVNVGKSVEADLATIGVNSAQDLIGGDPWDLYQRICRQDRAIQDPCLLDVLMAAVDYMNGRPPQPWWKFTPRRKKRYAKQIDSLKKSAWVR